jgi:hypothetical protein
MNKLNILWTTDNKDTVTHMLGMYAINAKAHGWWDEINVLIWGASQKLVASDPEIQKLVIEMQENGVTVEACKACADSFCVSESLAEMGVNVRFTGQALTEYLQSESKLLTV